MLNPYLFFDGDAADALNFYANAFGVDVDMISRYEEIPASEDMPPLTDEQKQRVMHGSMRIGDTILMVSDIQPSFGQTLTTGDRTQISVNPDSVDEGRRLYTALSEGGQTGMPFEKAFWGGAYFGTLTDKFSIKWMVNVETQIDKF